MNARKDICGINKNVCGRVSAAVAVALLATPLLAPAQALADRGDRWDDVRDAREDVRKEMKDVWEAQMDLRKEQREHDWKGARDAEREIRKNQRELREAQADYRRELSEARYGNRHQSGWSNNYYNGYPYGHGHGNYGQGYYSSGYRTPVYSNHYWNRPGSYWNSNYNPWNSPRDCPPYRR